MGGSLPSPSLAPSLPRSPPSPPSSPPSLPRSLAPSLSPSLACMVVHARPACIASHAATSSRPSACRAARRPGGPAASPPQANDRRVRFPTIGARARARARVCVQVFRFPTIGLRFTRVWLWRGALLRSAALCCALLRFAVVCVCVRARAHESTAAPRPRHGCHGWRPARPPPSVSFHHPTFSPPVLLQ